MIRCAIVIFVAALVATPAPARSQNSAAAEVERLRVARKVVQASGAEAGMLEGLELGLAQQRAQGAGVPEEFMERFAKKARNDIGVLTDSLAPVYAARFTTREIEQLLAFYEGPLGKRVVAEQVGMLKDTQQLGMRWGSRIGATIALEMANEGKPLTP